MLSLDPSALDGHGGKVSKLGAGPVGLGGEVLYPDPRALWAALTPSGSTQHFVGPSAPQPPVVVPHLQLTQRHLTAPSPPPPAPQQPQAATAEPEYAMPALPLTAGLKAGPPPLEPPPPPPVRVAAFALPALPLPTQPQLRHHGKHPRQHGHINKMATVRLLATDISGVDFPC